jgi:hypothetical protein
LSSGIKIFDLRLEPLPKLDVAGSITAAPRFRSPVGSGLPSFFGVQSFAVLGFQRASARAIVDATLGYLF